MKQKCAIAAWNSACRLEPIGVDSDGNSVTPITTFGQIVLSHIDIDADPTILYRSAFSQIESDKRFAVVAFLRQMADAMEWEE